MRANEAVEMLRRQRHDFTNHIQVLRGYLELEQASRALDYIKKISQDLNRERQLFVVKAPEVSIFLYRMYLIALERGLVFEVGDIQAEDLTEKMFNQCEQEMIKIYNEVGNLPADRRDETLIKVDISGSKLRVEVTLESGPLIREIVLTR